VTAEGYPGARYHAGCEAIDPVEQLAIDRARALFGAQYANVQPHSATTANYAVLSALLAPGDVVLGMRLNHGGHLTHGYGVAYSGTYFTPVNYGLDAQGRIDYDEVAALAAEHRPKLIICGATAYPRTVDFARFRAIADSVGALLMADISHLAGLVAAGLRPGPAAPPPQPPPRRPAPPGLHPPAALRPARRPHHVRRGRGHGPAGPRPDARPDPGPRRLPVLPGRPRPAGHRGEGAGVRAGRD